jgi:hypothetical protein
MARVPAIEKEVTRADHLFAFSPSIQFRSKNIAPKYKTKIRSKVGEKTSSVVAITTWRKISETIAIVPAKIPTVAEFTPIVKEC